MFHLGHASMRREPLYGLQSQTVVHQANVRKFKMCLKPDNRDQRTVSCTASSYRNDLNSLSDYYGRGHSLINP